MLMLDLNEKIQIFHEIYYFYEFTLPLRFHFEIKL